MVRRPAGHCWINAIEPKVAEFQRIHEHIDRANLIIALVDKFRLPAICPYRYVSQEGGLITYGFNEIEPYPRSAEYIDRILKGEKPADLPVQTPTKYELVINLKTAKTLGLAVPPTLLGRADEVIE